ncbi:MAG TPA: HAD family hydrolase [Clostridiales bacterium]|nr:HAD family hydrolase [Clostridiales bacterium]
MSKRYDCIIWDWNGTLIDDVSVALSSVNDMLIKRNMKTIDIQDYYNYIDTPIIRFYEHLFDLNIVTFDTIAKEFAIGYDKHIPENPVMDNAREMLGFFKEQSISQLIISASNQEKIDAAAKAYGLYEYFACVSGADNINAESKIHRAKNIIKSFNSSWDKTLVIGDTLHDFQMAQHLGVDCVLLSRGHQGKADLQTANVPVIDNLIDLAELV